MPESLRARVARFVRVVGLPRASRELGASREALARYIADAPLTRDMLPASGPVIVCEYTQRPWVAGEYRRKWRMLAREADWLPPWRELLRVYHRLEARGDIRGGRFIARGACSRRVVSMRPLWTPSRRRRGCITTASR